MPTVVPILRRPKAGRDGRAPIWIRISDTTGARYISTGLRVEPKDWNEEKALVRRSHKDAKEMNAIIARKVAEAERAFLDSELQRGHATLEDVKRRVKRGGVRRDFFKYAEEVITRMERQGKADSARRYRHVVFVKLQGFTGKPLPFGRIDVRLLRDWETSLVKLGNVPSTVATAFRAFRSIYNKAEAEGLTEGLPNPFRRFKLAPVPRASKAKLTSAEMERLEAVGLPAGSPAWHARNAFVFAFYAAGMRFKDVCLLKRGDLRRDAAGAWRLHYTSAKTADVFALKLPPQAVEIARLYELEDGDPEEYLFPFLRGEDVRTPEKLRRVRDSRSAAVNKQLKKVAEAAGIEANVSFHIARHTFADLARVRGIDLHTISKALGHSSVQVTEGYLKTLDQHALDGAMDELFGGDQ